MISVVVPAHNEEDVIERCLAALLCNAAPGELEIIVVCNGCADRTAERARRFGPPVRIIETPVASKTTALNLGDAAATGFPRFFVDADVIFDLPALRVLADELKRGTILAAAPRVRFDTTRSPWPVRAFYRIADRLPSAEEGIGGSGVYGLSERGRKRFDQFPHLTADDGFVRIQFRPDERRTIAASRSVVVAPRTSGELLAITTRATFGTVELRRRVPGNWANKGPGNNRAVVKLLLRPTTWPDLGVYLTVKLLARWRARRKFRNQDLQGWERDQTSRVIGHPARS